MKHDKLISKIVTWTVGITLFFSIVNLLLGMPFMAIFDNYWKEHLVAAGVFFIPTALYALYYIIADVCKNKTPLEKVLWSIIDITLFLSVASLIAGLIFILIANSHWKECFILAAAFFSPTLFFIFYGIIVAIQCQYKTKQQAIENVKKRRGDGKYTKLEVEKELESMRRRHKIIEQQALENVRKRRGDGSTPVSEILAEIAELERQASNDSSDSSSSNN